MRRALFIASGAIQTILHWPRPARILILAASAIGIYMLTPDLIHPWDGRAQSAAEIIARAERCGLPAADTNRAMQFAMTGSYQDRDKAWERFKAVYESELEKHKNNDMSRSSCAKYDRPDKQVADLYHLKY